MRSTLHGSVFSLVLPATVAGQAHGVSARPAGPAAATHAAGATTATHAAGPTAAATTGAGSAVQKFPEIA